MFQRFGLDYCCGGRQALAEACVRKGLDAKSFSTRLPAKKPRSNLPRWDRAPLSGLIQFIVQRYHHSLRAELPALISYAARVEQRHGDKPGCPLGLRDLLDAMHQSVLEHLEKEERVLFPMILDGDGNAGRRARFACSRTSMTSTPRILVAYAPLTNNLTPSGGRVSDLASALPAARRARGGPHGSHSSREPRTVPRARCAGRSWSHDLASQTVVAARHVAFRSLLPPRFLGPRSVSPGPTDSSAVVTADGVTVLTEDDILTGQQVWQSTGGQQFGSIWGHGAYQAPDWSADWLHREATALLDVWAAREYGLPYDSLGPEAQGRLRGRLVQEMRTNTFDESTRRVTISADRHVAIERTATYYRALFGGDPSLAERREDYAMQSVVIADRERLEKLSAFFFWTAWASADQPSRHDRDVHEQLAARAADRQPADGRQRALVDGERHPPAGGHRRAGVVAGVPQGRRAAASSRRLRIRSAPSS